MMKKILENGFRLNIDYTIKLVEDVPDDQMAVQPNGFANHPKFTIGHLVTAAKLSGKVLGDPYKVPGGWDDLFRRTGPGDPRMPEKDADIYPHKDEMLFVFMNTTRRILSLIEAVEEEELNKQYKWKLNHYMPTVGDVLFFQCHIHHSWHIGQLAEWRRMMGFDSALAKL